jgi:hypothetical protein
MLTLAYILVTVGGVISLAGGIILLVAAFRVSVGWGLALLFLSWLVIPLVVFLVTHWAEARAGFLISIAGWVVCGVGGFVFIGSGFSTAMAEIEDFETPQGVEQPMFETAAPDVPEEEPATPVTPPTPTAIPTPVTSVTAESLVDEANLEFASRDQPPEVRILSFEELEEFVGQTIVIRLRDGKEMQVVLDSVDGDAVQVIHRMGGGTVSYQVKRESIEEIQAQ